LDIDGENSDKKEDAPSGINFLLHGEFDNFPRLKNFCENFYTPTPITACDQNIRDSQ